MDCLIFFLNEGSNLLICALYSSAACFLGVFLITKNRKRTKTFEPYVTMNMANGLYKLYMNRKKSV